MLRVVLLAIFLVFGITEVWAKNPKPALDWASEALRMTGESELIREQALKNLRRIPQLEMILRRQLNGPQRGLALDVISALEIRSLFPDLLKIARDDTTGFVYITLNNLMTSKNRYDLVKFYKKQLLCKFLCTISGPSQVVIIETLARLNEELPIEDLQDLYSDTQWPEVQAAILDYARSAILHHKKEAYVQILKDGLNSDIHQLREQAQSSLLEVPLSIRKKWITESEIKNLFKVKVSQDVYMQIRVAFGYKDARPARFVADRYERLFLIQSLIKTCDDKNDFACEFERDKKDSNLFSKRIRNTAGEYHLINLYITASSAGPDDENNRTNPYQKHLSRISRLNFIEGLRSAEIVFYVGHSRDGGGPDFRPPRLTKNFHADYPWYQKQAPGLISLLKNLKANQENQRSPFKLGLLSCNSKQYFEKRVRQASVNTQLVTVPKLLYYSDALEILSSEITKFIEAKISGSGRKS